MRSARFGLLALVFGIGGCLSVELEFQQLPPSDALGAVRPGISTRSQVLRALGPPEELRRPAIFERARRSLPQSRKILEGGDVFGSDAYTYASARRRLDSVGILPIRPLLFVVSWRNETEERWRIDFDEADVVTSVSRVDESRDAGEHP
jgi:hypothetical protein